MVSSYIFKNVEFIEKLNLLLLEIWELNMRPKRSNVGVI
jgi:hypothetical protein